MLRASVVAGHPPRPRKWEILIWLVIYSSTGPREQVPPPPVRPSAAPRAAAPGPGRQGVNWLVGTVPRPLGRERVQVGAITGNAADPGELAARSAELES